MTNNVEQDSTATTKHRFNTAALVDLVIIMATLIIVKQSMLTVSTFYAGPVSTLSAMLLATYLLRRRGLSWHDLGLRYPESWLKTLGLAILTFFVFALTMNFAGVLADMFFEDVGASGRFDHIEGNWSAYIVVMLLTWTHASLFEELLFRAFVINRASSYLGGGLVADLTAAVFSAVFFGYRHYYYQGMNGAITTGAAGLAFALLYLWFGKKNILPLVFAHGTMNSIGMTFRFLGIKQD